MHEASSSQSLGINIPDTPPVQGFRVSNDTRCEDVGHTFFTFNINAKYQFVFYLYVVITWKY